MPTSFLRARRSICKTAARRNYCRKGWDQRYRQPSRRCCRASDRGALPARHSCDVISDDQPYHLRAFGKLAVLERIAGFELDEGDDGHVVFFKLRAIRLAEGPSGRAGRRRLQCGGTAAQASLSRRDRPFGTFGAEIHRGLQENFGWELTGSTWMCQIATWLQTEVLKTARGNSRNEKSPTREEDASGS
jgi:hypothetical protein